MSIDITNNIDIELDVLDVTQSKNDNSISTPDQYVKVEESEFPVEVTKKEYTIIGDGLYASVTAEEAPTWLLGLIDEVVDSAVASGMIDYDLLTQDVRSAIDALDVASNTYVEQVNVDATINNIITSRLATLNASLENTYATKTELTTAVVNADSALVQQVNNLTASFNDSLSSEITSVEQAFANADSAIAEDINQLTATFEDQEANLSAAADAISGLQTYVGLDGSSVPDNTGLLARTSTLENQVDGKVEYYFYDTYADITGATSESNALDLIDNAWNTAALRQENNGNVVYFKDSQNGYWYQSSTPAWLVITDTSIYQALQEAANAQASADGKVSQFYAWYDAANDTPANFNILGADGTTVIDTVVASNFKYWLKTDGKLYYYTGSTWEEYSPVEDGDILSAFNIDTRDVTVYTYNGTSWQQSGPTGIVSRSKFFIDLENNVTGPNGHVATSISNLQTTSEAYANSVGTGVENKFAYNSEVILNGQYYTSGFGLNSTGVTQPVGADGTSGNAFSSEFWINAEKFKFTNSNSTGSTAPFSIDASGTTPQITFNGKVNFTNITNPPAIASPTDLSDSLIASIGAVPAFGSNVASNLSYDSSEQAIKLFSSSDSSIGLAFPAFKVNTNSNEKVNLSLSYKSNVANSNGFYIRIYEYDSDLPAGKTHVSDQSSSSSPAVQEDTRQNSSWKENASVTTSWVTTNYEYTPTATAKWASVVVLNWTGIGTNPLYIKGYSKTTIGADIDTSALALKDMSNVTTIDGGKISTGSLSALSANLGSVTSGTLQNSGANAIPDANNPPSGSEQGAFIDLDNGKFVFGDANEYIHYNGTTLDIQGTINANNITGDVITVIPFIVPDLVTTNDGIQTYEVAEILMPAADHPDGHTPNAIVSGQVETSGSTTDIFVRLYMKGSVAVSEVVGVPTAVLDNYKETTSGEPGYYYLVDKLTFSGDLTQLVGVGELMWQTAGNEVSVVYVVYDSVEDETYIGVSSTQFWNTSDTAYVGLAANTYYRVANLQSGRTGATNVGRPFTVQGSLGKSLPGDITLKIELIQSPASTATVSIKNTTGTLMGLR